MAQLTAKIVTIKNVTIHNTTALLSSGIQLQCSSKNYTMLLKTKLPENITTISEAKIFLSELNKNKESFHPDNSSADCLDYLNLTIDIYFKIDVLMEQVLYLDNFDAYSYILNDLKVFMVKDLTGRGYTVKRKGSEIIDENQDNEDLINFIESATFGDEYKTPEEKYTHI